MSVCCLWLDVYTEPESPVLTTRMAPHQLPNGYSAPLAMDSASGSPVVVEESKTVQMKKRLGLMGGTALIVGTMIGKVIFCFFAY